MTRRKPPRSCTTNQFSEGMQARNRGEPFSSVPYAEWHFDGKKKKRDWLAGWQWQDETLKGDNGENIKRDANGRGIWDDNHPSIKR